MIAIAQCLDALLAQFNGDAPGIARPHAFEPDSMFAPENFDEIPRLHLHTGIYRDGHPILEVPFSIVIAETTVARCCKRGGRQFVEGGRLA
ncbi:hypothetical protein D3C77_710340 [compost metagenome]